MKYVKLVILTFLIILTTSCKQTTEQQIDVTVKEFAEALYNLDYEKARQLCTPQSALIISLLASNITGKDIEKVEKAGKALIDIKEISINEDETKATVKCKVSNFLKLDIFSDNSVIEKEAEETFYLIKSDNEEKWQVELHI